MKERPILMRGPLVVATLADIKTETRRIVKPQPHKAPSTNGSGDYDAWPDGDSCLEWNDIVADTAYYVQAGFCPYGQPGDRLWVRETWTRHPDDGGILYRATDPGWDDNDYGLKWRPSIFMPRWASRLTLEITSVRVERVQEITEAGAIAEGVDWAACHHSYAQTIGAFASLWDSINAKRGYGWAVNPYVWVIQYKRVAQ